MYKDQQHDGFFKNFQFPRPSNAAKVVRTVRTILHDIDPIKPTTDRLYMWEAWPYDESVHMISMTYNRDWVACERQRLIEIGQLDDAYRLQFVLGLWHLTEEKGERLLWWKTYYKKMKLSECEICKVLLFEERGISQTCHHQLCAVCMCLVTKEGGTQQKPLPCCPDCGAETLYNVFNGKQCAGLRGHDCVVMFYEDIMM